MRRTRKARVVTAKIIEFPGQWWRAPEAAPCEGVFSNAALTLVIGPADDSSPQCSAFMSADETLADLHRLISQGCDRYEDPLLFATQDRVSARCRRIYCAADVPLSRVFSRPEEPLYYTYALPNGRELKIVLDDTVALKLFG